MSAGHDHSHSHSHGHHHHDHAPKLGHLNSAFIWGIVLNSVFVVVEAITGFITHSLSLLTDAGHNLSDVASLALALLAFKLTKVSANSKYTYGYKRSTIIVSFFNAVILFAAVGFIIYEAITRFMNPEIVSGGTMAWVAFIGIGINAFTAWLFVKDKDTDLNIKGAYLHMAVDAIVSFGVVISGIIIYFTKLYWIDSAVSLIIGFVILRGTWSLLTASLRLEMDGVPAEMDLDKIKAELKKAKGVVDVHHMHVWALSTTENALTAHLVIKPEAMPDFDNIKHDLRHRLEHLDISHSTFEPEFSEEGCKQPECL
ncbi:cation transporter [Mucilaginibacter rubeus]|uniref:Cation transporter n=1 Tax=Mucilaginibacter rubeus TaxID=2027860 RepID=A0AAE6JH81_9SPHI|nr:MULTISPECIES: cation diffusion facilitator family transporter [Mucilaginibacter]QEM05654.1 cation transporter [Mucilaginibacter rubeus]QEM18241.1 cation transporter [Mucilaginibacter gossypii]QTE45227.1 cation transporter [Mucilaginibacter rubeus]QTE51823.1 cation transporter [Mucilaginibacter rubeus]QTE56910.1 cation transporter [Mucilaginibacter rubeus]